MDKSIIFASYAETDEQLQHILFMTESIREFAGKYSVAPISVYISDNYVEPKPIYFKKLQKLGAVIKTSKAPKESLWLYYSGKVYAAGMAEADTDGKHEILVWMDEDTIVLREPLDFDLDDNISFAYRPVMHNRSGSLFNEPPDEFWARIYALLEIKEETLFSMETPADKQTIRAYFNAGILIVRPEKGILRKWVTDFETLYADSTLISMSKNDITKRIFLHQTPLVGLLNIINKDQMIELPETYNYPIFFHRQYEAVDEFCSIEDIVTLRYDYYFRDPDPNWSEKLKGSSKIIKWLEKRLGKE